MTRTTFRSTTALTVALGLAFAAAPARAQDADLPVCGDAAGFPCILGDGTVIESEADAEALLEAETGTPPAEDADGAQADTEEPGTIEADTAADSELPPEEPGGADIEDDTEAVVEPAPDEPAPDAETDAETGADAETSADVETAPEPEVEPEPEPEVEPEIAPEPEAPAAPEQAPAEDAAEPDAPAPDTEVAPEAEAAPADEAADDGAAAAGADAAPEVTEAEAEPAPGTEAAPATDAAPDADAGDVGADVPADEAADGTPPEVTPPAETQESETPPAESTAPEAEALEEALEEAQSAEEPASAGAEAETGDATAEDAAARREARQQRRAERRAAAAVAAATAEGEAGTEAEVTTEEVTEDSIRTSDEDFETTAAGDELEASGESDEGGLSNFERALIVGLGAVAVGSILSSGEEVVANTGDRVVVERDGELVVLKDDDVLLRQPGTQVQTRTFDDGSTTTTVTRPNGIQIVTIRAADGSVLRRERILPDGTGQVIFDDTAEVAPVDVQDLPAPEVRETGLAAADVEGLRAALSAANAQEVGRSFSLRQIRDLYPVRALAPQVNLDAVTFNTGSAAITPTEAEELTTLGQAISDIIFEDPRAVFLVEGHTDAVGDASYNLALSDRRAESVALALTEYFDVPPENLITQGYGESQLKVETEAAERQNRRATVRNVTNLLR